MNDADADKLHRMNRRADDQLATSSPDFNFMMARIGRYLLRPVEITSVWQSLHAFTRTFAGMWIISLMIFFVVGLPAINGATIFFQSLDAGKAKEREFQLQMFKLQTDLELAKLDRTMLGDGAMKTLSAIAEKLDAQGVAIQRLSGDVSALTKAQAAADRRIAGVAAEQGRLREAQARGGASAR